MIIDVQPIALPQTMLVFPMERCDTCVGDRPHRRVTITRGTRTGEQVMVCNVCHPKAEA